MQYKAAKLALWVDLWVVSTMIQGNHIQFLHRPSLTRSPNFAIVKIIDFFPFSEDSHEGGCNFGPSSWLFLPLFLDSQAGPLLFSPPDIQDVDDPQREAGHQCKRLVATVNLKVTYFQIPIWQGWALHWCFLRFGFEGCLLASLGLPEHLPNAWMQLLHPWDSWGWGF